MKSTSRSSTRFKLLLAAPFAAAAAPAADASVVYTPIAGGAGITLDDGADTLFVSFSNQTYQLSSFVGAQFKLYFSNAIPRLNFPVSTTLGGQGVFFNGASYQYYAVKFADGATIYGNSNFGTPTLLQNDASGNWPAGDPAGYLGMRFNLSGNVHYGWVEVERLADKSLIAYGFAYETTVGQGILAGDIGPVPEPGETALLAALAAGSAAAFAARNRRKRAIRSL